METERSILITGAGGMLARSLVEECERRALPYQALSHAELDVTNPEAVRSVMRKIMPWAVVNAAGRVCEDATLDAPECYRDNTGGAAVLAGICERMEARLVTFTSDWVFDGRKGSPYDEDDEPNPTSTYGLSQREAERCVRQCLPEALIVRTSTLFGPWNSRSVVHRVMRSVMMGESLKLWTNRIVTPTYLPDLVPKVLDLLLTGQTGTWHLTNANAVHLAEFASVIARMAGLDVPAVRAAGEPFATPLVSRRGVELPDWRDAAQRYVAEHLPRFQARCGFAWK